MKSFTTVTKFLLLITLCLLLATCEEEQLPEPQAGLTNKISFENTNVDQIGYRGATLSSSIDQTGSKKIIQHGFCWDTQANPDISKNHNQLGAKNDTAAFTTALDVLLPNTTYYFRAYVTFSETTIYSQQGSFTTNPLGIPTLSTGEITSITSNSATSGGSITDDGGAVITARGVCWNTTGSPSISDKKTTDGTGTGSFTSSLTGLESNTTYHVRTYATNEAGTAYGNEITFTTKEGIPDLTTSEVTSITINSATSGGNITSDGGAVITARGVCWNTTGSPSISDKKTTDGTGTGSFTSSLTGLESNTTYYIRAYATNSASTGYGDEEWFKTAKADITGETGTFTDYDGNTYNWVGIGKQAWMAENLRVTHYADGTAIPLVTDNTAWENLDNNSTDDAYCWYNNNETIYKDTYGALYTWAAAMNGESSSNANPSGIQGVCPDGWHLPSDDEWTELEDYITTDGYSGTEGTALKATGGWNSNGNGTDIYGYSAFPGGYRNYNSGTFNNSGSYGDWWSSSENGGTYAYYRYLFYSSADVGRYSYYKSYGFSVRCVRD